MPLQVQPITRRRRGPRATRARGFTVIEMLVVLAIIGILAGLLLPAIAGALRTARVAQVTSEITLIENALTQFHSRYGVYPPSRICLHENPVQFPYSSLANPRSHGTNNQVADDALTAADVRTVQFFRKLWPKFNPANPASIQFGNNQKLDYYDFNGNGKEDRYIEVSGSECLVFFLGGMPQPLVTDTKNDNDPNNDTDTLLGIISPGGNFALVSTRGLEGFSKVPELPFGRAEINTVSNDPNVALSMGAAQRDAPLFEFNSTRLSDVDGDGFWEYYDPLQDPVTPGAFDPLASPHPYVYFSAYDGQGYNWLKTPGTAVGIVLTFDNAWNLASGNPVGLGWPLSKNTAEPAQLSAIQWWNERTYQIISPGIDGLIGQGLYGPIGVAVFNPTNPSYDIERSLTPELHDDITNFSGGELEDME